MGKKPASRFIVVLHNKPGTSWTKQLPASAMPVEILYIQALGAKFDATNYAYTGAKSLAAELSASVSSRVVSRCLKEINTAVSITVERVA